MNIVTYSKCWVLSTRRIVLKEVSFYFSRVWAGWKKIVMGMDICVTFVLEKAGGGLLSNQTEQGPCVSVKWAWKKTHGSRELQVWNRNSHTRNGGLGQMCDSGEGKEDRVEGLDLPRPVSWCQVKRRRNCKSLWTWRNRMVGKCTVGRWALCSFSVVHYSQVIVEWTPFGDGQPGPWV